MTPNEIEAALIAGQTAEQLVEAFGLTIGEAQRLVTRHRHTTDNPTARWLAERGFLLECLGGGTCGYVRRHGPYEYVINDEDATVAFEHGPIILGIYMPDADEPSEGPEALMYDFDEIEDAVAFAVLHIAQHTEEAR